MSSLDTIKSISWPAIAPSMLKCDFGDLQTEIDQLTQANAEVLHLDVMDGHFVPNLSYGPMVIERIRQRTQLVVDAHLMISEPERYLDEFVKAGCDGITFHIEAVPEPIVLLRKIRAAGCWAGIALNPGTSVEAIEAAKGECDLVLVMSVEPGFGGQKFKPEALPKVEQIKAEFPSGTVVSIDGGIGPETIQSAAKAGVDLFVAGSSIFDQADYGSAIQEMHSDAVSARS